MAMENLNASKQEQPKRVKSYEMRACPFSGLPGGYPEAPRAGANSKNACSIAISARVRTHILAVVILISGWSQNVPLAVARVNQAAVPHEPPRCWCASRRFFVSRLHLLNNDQSRNATAASDEVLGNLKYCAQPRARKEMGRAACCCAQDAPRVAVRCSDLYEEGRMKQITEPNVFLDWNLETHSKLPGTIDCRAGREHHHVVPSSRPSPRGKGAPRLFWFLR
jgi:hypothetical protein